MTKGWHGAKVDLLTGQRVDFIDYVSAYPKEITDMSNVPCQECGNEFDLNTAKTIVNRQGMTLAPPICHVCIDDLAFTLYEDHFRDTHLKRAEGRESDVERVARITWSLYKASSHDYERAIVDYEYDRARVILANHPRRSVIDCEFETSAEIVNPYIELCPKPGQSLTEFCEEQRWPRGIMPMPLVAMHVPAGSSKIIYVQPPLWVRPYMFLVDPLIADRFQIGDIRQGNRSLLLSADPLPANIFKEPKPAPTTSPFFAHSGILLEFQSMSPAERLILSVYNTDEQTQSFRACLLCIVDVEDPLIKAAGSL